MKEIMWAAIIAALLTGYIYFFYIRDNKNENNVEDNKKEMQARLEELVAKVIDKDFIFDKDFKAPCSNCKEEIKLDLREIGIKMLMTKGMDDNIVCPHCNETNYILVKDPIKDPDTWKKKFEAVRLIDEQEKEMKDLIDKLNLINKK